MGIDDLPLEEKIKRARKKLNQLRAEMKALLGGDSLRYKDVTGVMTDYVLFLHRMPFVCYQKNKSDISVDLEIVKDMGRKCKAESDKAKIEYFELQFAFIYALRKKAVMQLKLEGILKDPDGIPDELDLVGSPDELDPDRSLDEFQNECCGLLEDWDWDRTIKDTIQMEKEMKTQAVEEGENVDHLIQTVEPDPVDVNDPDQVKQQFTSYSYEITKVSMEMDENLSMCAETPEMCGSAEKLVRTLEKYCSYCDDIKVDKASRDVHCSIQPEDGGRGHEKSQYDGVEPIEAEQSGQRSYKMTEDVKSVSKLQSKLERLELKNKCLVEQVNFVVGKHPELADEVFAIGEKHRLPSSEED